MLGVFVVLAASLVFPTSTVSSGSCSFFEQQLGLCTTNDGTSITIGGEQTTPGTPGSNPGSNIGSNPGPSTPPSPPPVYTGSWCDLEDAWWNRNTASCATTVVATPSVTISDLVRFTPPGSPLTVEPFGVGIAGLPSNFVASSATYNTSGTLFGRSIRVRFTPDLHRFHYGDGSTVTTRAPGVAWETAGQAQFTPTATGHVYATRGLYTVRVDVLYTARVNFGTAWITVSGHVTARGPSQQVQVYEPRTALVAYTCDELPGASGC